MELNIVVSGMPNGYQGESEDGLWLTEIQRERLEAAAPGLHLEHLPVSALHAGIAPERAPHAILVESSGTNLGWEREPGILKMPGLETLITPALRLMQSASAGVEHLVDVIPDGVVLSNASGVHSKAIAETVIASILSDAKMLPQRRIDQSERVWRQLPARELEGSIMVVVGTGNIGSAVAHLAQAFGMRTIGVNSSGRPGAHFDEVSTDLIAAAGDADFLVIAAPLTPETRQMVDEAVFAALPMNAYLANVSRGGLIDDAALIAALENGRLRRALLDTHTIEPLPEDSVLWSHPRVEISPHDSHASQLLGDRHLDLFIDNIQRLIDGRELRNVVDLGRGY